MIRAKCCGGAVGIAILLLSLTAGGARAVSATQPASRPVIRDFLGLNGHTVLFKPDLYAPVCSLARDYHPVSWDLANDTAALPDFPFAKNRVNWSSVYGSWRKAGWRIDACLQFESIAPDRWHDLDADAFAYAKAFASQFGPSSSSPLVEAVEIGNEPGKYGDEQYTRIFGAMARGIRAADPKLRIATCNLTCGKSHAYAKSVATIQGMTDLVDVLTIHTYAQLEPYPTWRRSFPEDPRLSYLKDVEALAQWRDEHAPGKPLWITEFGYDATTKTPDPKTEFAKWVGVSETQQAQYLVRSVLVFAALPAERAYVYFFNDDDAPQLHGSSGLTRKFIPKPAYYALAHLQKTLGEFRFARALVQKPGEAYAYLFTHGSDPRRRIVVAWSPTGSARSGSVALDLAGWRITRAEAMPLAAGAPPAPATVSPAAVPISESPLYLHLEPER